MKPIEVEVRDQKLMLHCQHEARWPPLHTKLDKDIEYQRASGLIDDHKYEQIKTWERVCGLMEMDAGKCVSCPLARTPEIRTKGGKVATGEMRPLEPVEKPRPAPYYARARKGRG
jgi:hypothetical protein